MYIVAASGFLIYSPFAHSADPGRTEEPVAVIAGQMIYADELLPLVKPQLLQLQNEEYQIKSRALETLMDQKLLEAAASERGVSVEELLKQELDAKLHEPTEGEVESYYLGRKDTLKSPLDEIKPQLRQALKQARLQQVREVYLKRLRERAEVAVLLTPPKVEIGYDPTRLRGNPDAPITIVEFSDFQCPYCKRALPTLQEVLARYQDQVRLAYRDFPLTQLHPQAQIAAEASRCAAEQGQFWAYHDLLFSNQAKLDATSLAEYARDLSMDGKQFEACLASGKFKTAVEQDLRDGQQAGVAGTPAFFINGVFLSGAQPLKAFARVIEEELTRTRVTAQR
jgi:protein-disulfide isomerase